VNTGGRTIVHQKLELATSHHKRARSDTSQRQCGPAANASYGAGIRRPAFEHRGRYNPGQKLDATRDFDAPEAVYYDHTAVGTGSEMIVWGGLASPAAIEHRRAYNSQARQLDSDQDHQARPAAR